MKIRLKEDFKGDKYKVINNAGVTILILYVVDNVVVKTSEKYASWAEGTSIEYIEYFYLKSNNKLIKCENKN